VLKKYLEGDPSDRSRMAAKNAECLLMSGVTTVRDAGSSWQLLGLERETVPGIPALPRLQLAGPPITVTAGHLHFIPGSEADTADELVLAVRQRQQRGCTAIKIIASGGQLTPGSYPERASYSAAEIRIMTREAQQWNLPTFAHCLTTESFANAMAGGVQCIEHCACFVRNTGNQLLERVYEPSVMASFRDQHRYFMNGISNNYHAFDHCRHIPEIQTPREAFLLEQEQRNCENFRKLTDLGMIPVVGTDAGCSRTYFDETWLELEILHQRCGLSAADTIQAATANGAAALGLGNQTGRLAPGLAADMIALAENPLRDIRAFRKLGHIMLNGQVIR
jgi:imidazolonepropionase-like amidohydrolase